VGGPPRAITRATNTCIITVAAAPTAASVSAPTTATTPITTTTTSTTTIANGGSSLGGRGPVKSAVHQPAELLTEHSMPQVCGRVPPEEQELVPERGRTARGSLVAHCWEVDQTVAEAFQQGIAQPRGVTTHQQQAAQFHQHTRG
jgi:hypothetical protein